jgi:hypothetical protein
MWLDGLHVFERLLAAIGTLVVSTDVNAALSAVFVSSWLSHTRDDSTET